MNKFDKTIGAYENKEELKNIFTECGSKTKIFERFNLAYNTDNSHKLNDVFNELKFSFENIKKPIVKRFCLFCGKEIDLTNKDKKTKFCNSSCAAKYNNHRRKHSDETKKKISDKLKKNGNMAKQVDAFRSKRNELTTHESSNLSIATTKIKKYTVEDVKREISNSKSFTQLCRNLGITERGGNIKTLKTIVLENNFDISHFTREFKYDDLIINVVPYCKSYSEVCKKIGVRNNGRTCTKVKKRIEELGLDTTHFTGKLWSKGKTSIDDDRIKTKDINDFLVENSNVASHRLKQLLIKYSLKEYKCECCGNTEWLGKKIPLQLHHINGNHYDNRIENLMIICPNCHAQTENYCGKNIK